MVQAGRLLCSVFYSLYKLYLKWFRLLFFWRDSSLLLSLFDKPECHKGAAYSVMGLRSTFHAFRSSSVLRWTTLKTRKKWNFLFTFLQICEVFSFQRKSAVMVTPRSFILETGLSGLPFSCKFWGAMFFFEKLKVMTLHLVSLRTILSFSVSVASMSRTLWRKDVQSPFSKKP